MNFLVQSKLVYSMTEALVLLCEAIEEVWTSAIYNSTDKVLTFNLNGKSYSIDGDVLSTCLNFFANTHTSSPTETEIKVMLNDINYVELESNLGKIVRKKLRKEWSYFFDCIIKVFIEKISNFDVITQVVQEIAYGVLFNHFHNLGDTIFNGTGFELGNTESRHKNIYFARFIMLLTIHVAPEMESTISRTSWLAGFITRDCSRI